MSTDARPIMWVIVIAGALTAVVALAVRRSGPPPEVPATPPAHARTSEAPTASAAIEVPKPGPIAHPPTGLAELDVMTDWPEEKLRALVVPPEVAALLEKRHCGDARACEAVKAFVKDGERTHFLLERPGDVKLPRELSLAASALSADQRARLKGMHAIVVRAEGAAFPSQLPARAAFAAAAALAEKTGGFVYDELTERIEGASQFLPRVITAPLDGDAFARERIDVQYAARGDGNVRLLTAGLRRFGCADLDVAEVEPRYAQAMSDLLDAAADLCARGIDTNPVSLTSDVLARVRGDAGAPTKADANVYLVAMEPEPDDPSDYMARLVPAEGATPDAYAALAARFFGASLPKWDPPPDPVTFAKDNAQKLLPDLLARAKKHDGSTVFLEVVLDDAPPDGEDAGEAETAWIEVKSFDETTVTGALTEDAAADPELAQGAILTRPRSAVIDYQVELPDGATEDL